MKNMKFIALCGLACLWVCANCFAADPVITHSNGNKAGSGYSGSATTQNVTFPFTTVAGNTYVALMFWKNDVNITSVSDDEGGNSWVDVGLGRVARPTDGYMQIYIASNVTGGTMPTVTMTLDGTGNNLAISICEVQDVVSSSPVVAYGSGTATSGTSVSTGSMSPGVSSGISIARVDSNNGSPTAGTNYTVFRTYAGGSGDEEWSFGSDPGTIVADLTMSATITKALIVAVVLKGVDAGGGGGTAVPVFLHHYRDLARR